MKVGENLYIRKAPQGKIYHPLEVTSRLLTYNNGNQTFMQHSNDKTLKCFLVSDTDSVKIQIKENNHSLGQVLYIFLQQFRKYVRRKTTAKYSKFLNLNKVSFFKPFNLFFQTIHLSFILTLKIQTNLILWMENVEYTYLHLRLH